MTHSDRGRNKKQSKKKCKHIWAYMGTENIFHGSINSTIELEGLKDKFFCQKCLKIIITYDTY